LKKNKELEIFRFILSSIINVAFSLFVCFVLYKVTVLSFNSGKVFGISETLPRENRPITVKIPDDSKLVEVADLLKKNGVISNKYLYILENVLKGNVANYSGGDYSLNSNMPTTEINTRLRKDILKLNEVSVTIYEGYTVSSIAELLVSNGVISDFDDFINIANENDFNYFFLKDKPEVNKLEGYLFPDTYLFFTDSTPDTAITKLLSRFEDIYSDELILKSHDMGLSIDEVITIASLIEKEVEINKDISREMVSSYIHNRLKKSMNLELKSTVAYALKRNVNRVTDDDLTVDSPYNTFVVTGLPVTPICNPGLKSINAALNPSESDILYFQE
jgi:UPF0755 protein